MNSVELVLIGIVALGIGVLAGFLIRRFTSEAKLESVRGQAGRILQDADKDAQSKVKEALLEAKDEIYKTRQDAEGDLKQRREEVARVEQRLEKRDETLDRRDQSVGDRERDLTSREKGVDEQKDVLKEKQQEAIEELEKISSLSSIEAKELILKRVEDETRHETAKMVREIETRAREEADSKSRNILTLAIQRCASDHVAESTVSVVRLPSDDMKGRIIGREGRNIRAIETLTGVNLIIDDTPEAILLSGFDPVRREVARLTLEKLIADGRIHPSRIEETFEKAQADVETKMREAGEQAAFDTGVHGVNPELIKVLGRLRYRTSYGQNVLKHSVECCHLAGLMAAELGADEKLAKRAGFLHDLGKAVDHEVEGSHASIGADLARRYGESAAVVHAIEAHHAEVEPQTVEAVLVQASDALSASRPGARRESLENYVKRLEALEEIANSKPGVEKAYAMQAGRDIRVMVRPDKVKDDETHLLAREIAQQIENDLDYPGQIRVTIVRESRAVEYAK